MSRASSVNSSSLSRKKKYRARASGLPRTVFASSLEQILHANSSSQTCTSSTKSIKQEVVSSECSNGGMEALRLCHTEFISLVASSLQPSHLSLSKDNAGKYIKDESVKQCMKDLGFQNILKRALNNIEMVDEIANHQPTPSKESSKNSSKSNNRSIKRSRKLGKKTITAQMAAEQERLLAASAQAHAMKNKKSHVVKLENIQSNINIDTNTDICLNLNQKIIVKRESKKSVDDNQLSWKDGSIDQKDSCFDLDDYLT